MVLHGYAKRLQREAEENFRWAILIYNTAAPYQRKGSTLKPPERPAILEWELR